MTPPSDASYAVAQSAARCCTVALIILTRADQPTRQKNEQTADDNLEHRRQQRCVHIAFANPRNSGQLGSHHDQGDGGGQTKIADQVGQRMAKTAELAAISWVRK